MLRSQTPNAFPSRLSFVSASGWVLAACSLLWAAGTLGESPSTVAAAQSPLPAEAPLGAGRGLARAAADRKPIYFVVIPANSLSAVREWQESQGKSTRKRLDHDFIVIEVVLTAEGKWPAEEPKGEGETPVPWAPDLA